MNSIAAVVINFCAAWKLNLDKSSGSAQRAGAKAALANVIIKNSTYHFAIKSEEPMDEKAMEEN